MKSLSICLLLVLAGCSAVLPPRRSPPTYEEFQKIYENVKDRKQNNLWDDEGQFDYLRMEPRR